MINNQEIITNYLKKYGFVYQNSEIYNGLANGWDYGPLGAILKNNLKNELLNYFVFSQPNMTLLDTSIILNSDVWQASGHLTNFSDPLIDCKNCKSRFRADKLLFEKSNLTIGENASNQLIDEAIWNNKITCPNCNQCQWTKVRKFNLMFKTFQGVTEDNLSTLYLRPETAQGIFINFKNILRTQRYQLPFGIGQIGKAFRNEITPGNFIFRTREFEQMEIEYFTTSEKTLSDFELFKQKIFSFLIEKLKINPNNLRIKEHDKNELAHYSKKTIDFEFKFPHGFGELWGLAHRGTFDLANHQKHSKKNLNYFDPYTNEEFLPNVIEPSVGIERLFYALITNSYFIEKISNDTEREVLKIPSWIAPYKVAILPLTNKLKDPAKQLYLNLLKTNILCTYDTNGSIGKRYRRMDAIGTPYCVTVDFETPTNNTVTVRERDSMKQEKVSLSQLNDFIKTKLTMN